MAEDHVPVASLVGGVVGLRVGAADGAPVVGDDGGGSVGSAEGRPRESESVEVDVSPRSAVGDLLVTADMPSRCVECAPELYARTKLVSRAFRTNAARMLERSLDFVRDHGERVLKDVVIPKEEWDANFENEVLSDGGAAYLEAILYSFLVREVSNDALTNFKLAWTFAGGEAMTAAIEWEDHARNRFLILVARGPDKGREEAHIVASFERAYGYLAARVDARDLLRYCDDFLQTLLGWWVRNGEEVTQAIAWRFVVPLALELWSDSRLKVSFIFGPLAQSCHQFNAPEYPFTKSSCDTAAMNACESLSHGDSERSAAFRLAYDDMMSTVTMADDDVWDPRIALAYARAA